MKDFTITILPRIIAAMTLAAALFILAGCSPKVVHVPVETVRIDTFRHAVRWCSPWPCCGSYS